MKYKTKLIFQSIIASALLAIASACDTKAPQQADKESSEADTAAVQTLFAQQEDNNRKNFIEYTKTSTKVKEQILCRTGYTVSYNPDWRIPNWVAYELTAEEAKAKGERGSGFEADPDIKERKATPNDYAHSGYDRGHMAPAGDMKWSGQAMRESFYLSNICPQRHGLNTGSWNDLEIELRRRARNWKNVNIVCGPIVGNNHITIGKNKVAVPDAFFKVICWKYRDKYEGKAFIFPNEHITDNYHKYSCTIDEVEKQTGHDFFFNIDDANEDNMEANDKKMAWF